MRHSRPVVWASSLKIRTGRNLSNLTDPNKRSSRDQEWPRDSRIHKKHGGHIWAIEQSRAPQNSLTLSILLKILDSFPMPISKERTACLIRLLTIHSSHWGKTSPRVLPARARTKEALHLPLPIKRFFRGTSWSPSLPRARKTSKEVKALPVCCPLKGMIPSPDSTGTRTVKAMEFRILLTSLTILLYRITGLPLMAVHSF